MKALLLFAALSLQFILSAQQLSRGPHQGVVKEAGLYKIEMLGCVDHIEVYLLDKDGQSISNYQIAGHVRFYFNNKTSQNSPLMPYGQDGFSAKIPQSEFFNCIITIDILSKSVSATFESECAKVTGSK
jgi:hypothetical protein